MFVVKRVVNGTIPKQLSSYKNIHCQRGRLLQKPNAYLQLDITGESLEFPHVWLRDNCQCADCFHHSARSRIIDWRKFDLNVQPKEVANKENKLQITWDDGHKSEYGLNWLKLRSFTSKYQDKYSEAIYKPTKISWHGDDFEKICSKHDYNQILKSDQALYNWLNELSIFGVALIENTPNDEKAIDSIIEMIGFTKRSHYGAKFVVQHLENTNNVAYSSANLQMHIDLPYYEHCAGINMLHCLVQTKSKGGENLLTDSHYVAKYLKETHPDKYKLLTETNVEWRDVGSDQGNEFYKLHRAPIICLGDNGEVVRTNFSIPQRGSHFPCELDKVVPWYEAYQLFLELSHTFAAKFKTKTGDILVFDNVRLVHGRNEYENATSNVRKLIGAYFDWDEVYSKLRSLKVKLNNIEGL